MLRLSSRSSTLLLAGTLMCACGGDPDPVRDAGLDGSSPETDAGPADAGVDPDGGVTAAAARDDARDGIATMESARLAVPADMRVGPAFLQLDMIATRLDAVIGEKSTSLIEVFGVIGEKSVSTLSLTDVAVKALVIVQQLGESVRELDEMIAASTWGASGEPTLAELETTCIALRDRVATLRDAMRARLRELIDTAVLTPRDEPAYVDARLFETIGGKNELDVVVEGRSAADPTATVSVDCGDFPATVRVLDGQGDELAPATTGAGGEPTVVSVTLGHDTVRVIRIQVQIDEIMFWNPCTATVTGRRRFRGASEPIDASEQSVIARESGNWVTGADGIANSLALAQSMGTLEPGRIAAIERLSREADAAVSRLRALQTATSIDADDYEIYDISLRRIVLPLVSRLVADPQIAMDSTLVSHLETWRTAILAMLVESAPGHAGGTL